MPPGCYSICTFQLGLSENSRILFESPFESRWIQRGVSKISASRKRRDFFGVYFSTALRRRNIFQACTSSTLTLLKAWHLIGTRTGPLRGEHVEVGTGKRKRDLAAIKDPGKLYGTIRYYALKKWPIWKSRRFCTRLSAKWMNFAK